MCGNKRDKMQIRNITKELCLDSRSPTRHITEKVFWSFNTNPDGCSVNKSVFILLIVKPTRRTNFSIYFYFGIKLHMFRTVPLSIIRSFPLYTQQWYMSYRFADILQAGLESVLILLASCQQTCMTYTIVVCTVKKFLMMDIRTVRNMWSFIPK